jgi:hypothetical protein
MDKKDILTFINTHNKEYRGRLVIEKYFKKMFPDTYEEMIMVKFPDSIIDFKQKLWHFLRDDYDEKVCECGGKLKFRNFKFGYNRFCRSNCSAMIKNHNDKIKSNPKSKSEKDKIQQKVKQTFLDRYGVERYSQTDKWKQQVIQTNQEKFGHDWFTQSQQYQEYYKEYCMSKYGGDIINSFQDREVKEMIRKKFYDSLLKRHPNIIEIRDNSFVCKCPDESCNLCKEKQFEIDKITFSGRNSRNIDICTIRTKYRSLISSKERSMYQFIRDNYNGEIVENDRTILDGKEIDIYLPDLHLGFEFNGIYWHSSIFKDRTYHQSKFLSCWLKGIQLIQIWEDDWQDRTDEMKQIILQKIYNENTVIEDTPEVVIDLDTTMVNNYINNGYEVISLIEPTRHDNKFGFDCWTSGQMRLRKKS